MEVEAKKMKTGPSGLGILKGPVNNSQLLPGSINKKFVKKKNEKGQEVLVQRRRKNKTKHKTPSTRDGKQQSNP
ncbi:hypothetical protein CsSME_00009351 [Camellia sinensis var. sinensis]